MRTPRFSSRTRPRVKTLDGPPGGDSPHSSNGGQGLSSARKGEGWLRITTNRAYFDVPPEKKKKSPSHQENFHKQKTRPLTGKSIVTSRRRPYTREKIPSNSGDQSLRLGQVTKSKNSRSSATTRKKGEKGSISTIWKKNEPHPRTRKEQSGILDFPPIKVVGGQKNSGET